jgi:hypothetical protein
MKIKKYLPLCILAGLVSSTIAVAGTSGITGSYNGTYQLTVRSSVAPVVNVIQGQSGIKDWSWDFDNSTVTIEDAHISPPSLPFLNINYFSTEIGSATSQTLPITDNGDGTYTVDYHFKAAYGLYGNPEVDTHTIFEISQVGDNLSIITLDSDGDGVAGERLSPPSDPFPLGAEPDWSGSAIAE